MQIIYSEVAKADLQYWIKSGNKSVLNKIVQLIDAISINPTEGIGKPEELKYSLVGYWSRRINQEHRVIYEIREDNILIHSLKGHYEI